MKYIKHFSNLSGQTEYLNSADIDTYLGYVDENDTVYYDDAIPVPYEEQYFTIEALTAGNLSVANAGSNVFNYSLDDGSTWNTLSTVAVNIGEKVLLKSEAAPNGSSGIGTINYTGNFNVYGNIMSLVYGDDFIGQTTINYQSQFRTLLSGNTTLISAEYLILPATTLANNCYTNMFNGCTSLTTAPELPATTLANNCYLNMFYGCTSLTTAPSVLPATTLAESCYMSMFSDCTNLTTAPVLPADTLASQCYGGMFYGCTSLNYIKAMFTTKPSNTYTFNWVKGVASSGTFVKNAAATWNVTGTYGIPSGWTVVNA